MRVQLDPNVVRIPIVPGCDPRSAYGDLAARGVRGVVLEAFGVGNMPDTAAAGWLPWLRAQRKAGVHVYLASQCTEGPLQPELYRCGCVLLQSMEMRCANGSFAVGGVDCHCLCCMTQGCSARHGTAATTRHSSTR